MPEGRRPRARASVYAGAAAVLVGSVSARSGLIGWRQALFAWLHRCAREETEQRRLFLWLPVLFGAGVLLYFAADQEPLLWSGGVAAAVFGGAAFAMHRQGKPAAFALSLALAVLFAGFFAACLNTAMVTAPAVKRIMIARTIAFVESIDYRTNGARLVLAPHTIEGMAAADVPRRVRVTMRWRPDFAAGATLSATLRLLPPPVQSEPGGYDFAREAFFGGIGAVGNLVSRPKIVFAREAGYSLRLKAWIDRGRNWLTSRIAGVIDGEAGAQNGTGAVAAALVTGKRGMIPESANEDLRAAGIYHIVSISGLHMVLAAGLFLWVLRAVFALFPGLVLARPIKVWAALFAMVGASAYCLFSGSEVATQRTLIMTLVMLGAVVAGRSAISMRNLAMAALLVLALDPNALLGPSFQMSFAAVAAMIGAFERRAGTVGSGDPLAGQWGMATPRDDPAQDIRAGLEGRVLLVLIAMSITTLVASVATDPYALYHFHRITPYGLLGNMLVLPLVEFVVMPAAVAGVVAAPFGLDGPVWWLMGQGIAFMMMMAQWVAGLQGSVILLPAFGAGALLIMTAGFLWLLLWQTPIRWAGLAVVATGIAMAVMAERPDVVISGQGRIVAYRNAAGSLDVLNARANKFGVAQWLASDADRRKPDTPGLGGSGRCDKAGCIGRLRDGRILALVLSRSALVEDCARADIVVTPLRTKAICKGPERIFDRDWLAAHGASRIFLSRDGTLRFETARKPSLNRPWSRGLNAQPRASRPPKASGQPKSGSAQTGGWVKAK